MIVGKLSPFRFSAGEYQYAGTGEESMMATVSAHQSRAKQPVEELLTASIKPYNTLTTTASGQRGETNEPGCIRQDQ
jgi:hypothetical protein